MLRKWESERALLVCNLSLRVLAAAFRGRLFAVSSDELRLVSDDEFSELTFPLSDKFSYGYGEPRDIPEEAKLYISTLVVHLTDEDDPETLILTEVIE